VILGQQMLNGQIFKLKIYTFRLHNMGCGSSSHPEAGSSDKGLDNDVNDPNKHTKSGKD